MTDLMIDLRDKLTASRATYLETLEGVEEEEAIWHKTPDCWSVLECAEHVANVEHRILRTIQNAPAIAVRAADLTREAEIYERTRSRANPIPAPELVRPIGRYATLAEAAGAFAGMRDRAIALVSDYSGDLRAIGATHPLLGPCNGYEYALIMAGHPIRHALQIDEIRQAYRAR